jgi:hypothetical protein
VRAHSTLLANFYGLVVRVPGYRSGGPEFYSWHCQIFWQIVDLEQDALSLVSTTEKLLDRKVAAPV